MRLSFSLVLFAAACGTPLTVTTAPVPVAASAGVVPGIEVLLTDSLHLIRGKRVGLLTNHSGRDRKGTSTIDLLFRAPGVTLAALYGPEHGIRGVAKAGEKIASSVDSATGVRVYSLYGDVRVPTPEMLTDIDVLLYDIQDVGARVYTYQWTLALAAAAARKLSSSSTGPIPSARTVSRATSSTRSSRRWWGSIRWCCATGSRRAS